MGTPKDYGWDWSGDYYGPGLENHLHALGVVATNYNQLELSFYLLFSQYFGNGEHSAALFAGFKNNFRIDALTSVVERYEHDPTVAEHVLFFMKCFNVCADNRNMLMHSSVGNVEIGAIAMTLRKPSRRHPARFTSIEFSVSQIRQTADEMWSLNDYAMDLVFWMAARSGLLPPDDPSVPSTLPSRPLEPSSLTLLLHKAGQGKHGPQ